MKSSVSNVSLVYLGVTLFSVLASGASLSKGEVCEIAPNINIGGGEDYTKGDQKDVQKLCSYDTHIEPSQASGGSVAVGVCPKLNSTFPAVEFIEIKKGQSKADVIRQCNKDVGQKNGGKLAKYKYSMSCAKTPSIVGYYHISRALGIKFVPPAVIRTMDLDSHIQVAKDAIAIVGRDSQLISKNWKSLLSKLENRDPALTTEDGELSLGALSQNPKGEQKTYDGVYLGGGNQGERLSRFMTSSRSTYRKLGLRKPIEDIVGRELTRSNYSLIQQMKDVSDMIVLDTIFGQKDRFGNTHSIYTWMVKLPDGSLKKYSFKDIEKMMKNQVKNNVPGAQAKLDDLKKAKDMKKDWRKEITPRLAEIRSVVEGFLRDQGLKYAFAENLMLKDNDCGLKGSNPFARKNVIAGVYHISPETFEQLKKLYQKVVVEKARDQFLTFSLLMNNDELEQFKSGLAFVAEDLMKKDEAGKLFKDLSVKSHFQ